MMMVIEKGVPIPDMRIKHVGRYPFSELEVGDRFLIPEGKHKRVRSCISARKKSRPERFVVRFDFDAWYCWRIK